MNKPFNINKNIAQAETLPAHFYRDKEVFEAIKEKVKNVWNEKFIIEQNTKKLHQLSDTRKIKEFLNQIEPSKQI